MMMMIKNNPKSSDYMVCMVSTNLIGGNNINEWNDQFELPKIKNKFAQYFV